MSDGWDDAPRGRSVVTGALWRGLIAAAVTFAAVALFLNLRGGDGDDTALGGTSPTGPTGPTAFETTDLAPTVPPQATTLPPLAPTTEAVAAIGVGVTVQVLSGPDTSTAQYEDAQNALQLLGYEVVDGGPVLGSFPTSEVWFTEGNEASAQALVAADPRFGAVEDNAGRLQAETDFHVIVGADWEPAGAGADDAPTATPTA